MQMPDSYLFKCMSSSFVSVFDSLARLLLSLERHAPAPSKLAARDDRLWRRGLSHSQLPALAARRRARKAPLKQCYSEPSMHPHQRRVRFAHSVMILG